MSTTTETTDLSTIAAAGLGRKAKTAAAITDGRPYAVATDGETWVEVWTDRPCDFTGPTDAVDPAPTRADVVGGATITGRDLRRIVAGVVPATDTESSRYALGGTLVEIAEGAMLTAVGTDGRRLHAVVSGADEWVEWTHEHIVEQVLADVGACFPRAMRSATCVRARVVKERRATFEATPAFERARRALRRAETAVPLAGDYTDTDWPATMEGATISGFEAARRLGGRMS